MRFDGKDALDDARCFEDEGMRAEDGRDCEAPRLEPERGALLREAEEPDFRL